VIILDKTTIEKSLSEKEILSCLGKVLSNARDWHGGRKKVKNISTSLSDSQQINTFFFVNENDQIEFVSTENQAKTLTDSLQQDATIQHFQKNNTLKSNNNTSSENFSESEWNESDDSGE